MFGMKEAIKQEPVEISASPFSKPWKGSDAVLIVEEKELHVHTQNLSLASPVFEKMFNGNFVEAKTKRVTLEGKKYELVEAMLRFIYPNTGCYLGAIMERSNEDTDKCKDCKQHFPKQDERREQNLDELFNLYHMSEEYMIEELTKRICNQVLFESNCIEGESTDYIIDLMKIGESLSNIKAVDNCLQYLSSIGAYSDRFSTGYKVEGMSTKVKDKNLSLWLNQKLKSTFLEKHTKILKQHRHINDKLDCAVKDLEAIANDLATEEL